MRVAVTAVCACLVCALPCPADEIKLKDGTKIIGNIVGFEKDSFKVETSYGFALVRKDKIESIIISDASKTAEAKKPDEPKAGEKKEPAPSPSAPSAAAQPAARSSPPPAKAAPPPEPLMRESVDGTTYTNHTFGFRMYKPPSWRVIEGARKMLPAAIVAMGTSDESTLLVMGRGQQRGTLDAQLAAIERELRSIYENYAPAPPERSVIAGQSAIQRRFRGMADEREWSGMIIVLGRGAESFTILGMTHSESDLIQIQENVIARTVASLEFLK
jgi:hypothetical protein